LHGRHRKEGESLRYLRDDIWRLVLLAYPHGSAMLHQGLAVHCFVQALGEPKLMHYLGLLSPKTLFEAYDIACRDLDWRSACSSTPKEVPVGGAPTHVKKAADRRRILICFKCRQEGHVARLCSRRSRKTSHQQVTRTSILVKKRPLVCWRCQTPGHISRLCLAPSPVVRCPTEVPMVTGVPAQECSPIVPGGEDVDSVHEGSVVSVDISCQTESPVSFDFCIQTMQESPCLSDMGVQVLLVSPVSQEVSIQATVDCPLSVDTCVQTEPAGSEDVAGIKEPDGIPVDCIVSSESSPAATGEETVDVAQDALVDVGGPAHDLGPGSQVPTVVSVQNTGPQKTKKKKKKKKQVKVVDQDPFIFSPVPFRRDLLDLIPFGFNGSKESLLTVMEEVQDLPASFGAGLLNIAKESLASSCSCGVYSKV